MKPAASAAPASLSRRGPEIAVALFIEVIAALVVWDSVRVGAGWGSDGPKSGYFPFYVGMLLGAAGLAVLLGRLRLREPERPFADGEQLGRVFAVLLPMVAYVAAIAVLGIYLASALLIGWFMWRHGRHGYGTLAAVSLGVPLVVFAVFERWFLIPLPKGPLERLLGL
jgi:putative tricarboxylic transport membrane protein